VTLALRVAGEPAELQPAAVRLGPGEHRRLRVLAAARVSPGGPALEARLDAAVRADERLRMTRALTFVPPGESRR
jgi:hypothetical protein